MARDMPEGLKRYDDVEVPGRRGSVRTSLKLTLQQARAQGLEPPADAEPEAKSKKRAAPKASGRARAKADDTSAAGDGDESDD